MDVDSLKVDPLAMVPYIAPPPKDLVRLRIVEKRLKDLVVERSRLVADVDRVWGKGERVYMALENDTG